MRICLADVFLFVGDLVNWLATLIDDHHALILLVTLFALGRIEARHAVKCALLVQIRVFDDLERFLFYHGAILAVTWGVTFVFLGFWVGFLGLLQFKSWEFTRQIGLLSVDVMQSRLIGFRLVLQSLTICKLGVDLGRCLDSLLVIILGSWVAFIQERDSVILTI